MKKLVVGLLAVVLMFGLAACGDKPENGGSGQGTTPAAVDFTASELADYINENVAFTDFMDVIDANTVYEMYGIDGSKVEDSCTYFSTGATAEEISVMKVATEDADSMLGEINKAFNDRVASQVESFTDYVPGELDKLSDPLIMEIGNAVIMVVCDDPDQAKKVILEYINQ